jgi:hypothetical protein
MKNVQSVIHPANPINPNKTFLRHNPCNPAQGRLNHFSNNAESKEREREENWPSRCIEHSKISISCKSIKILRRYSFGLISSILLKNIPRFLYPANPLKSQEDIPSA